MVTMLTRNWWTLALRGLVAVMFGIAALVWPQPTLELLVMVFGAVMLVDGVLALVAGSAARWWAPALVGVVEIIIGAATLISPATAGLILLALIAAWAVTTGILQVMVAVQLRREIDNEWLVALGGILSIAFGAFVVLFPGASAIRHGLADRRLCHPGRPEPDCLRLPRAQPAQGCGDCRAKHVRRRSLMTAEARHARAWLHLMAP